MHYGLIYVGKPEVVGTWTEGSVPNRDGRLATFQCYSSDTPRQLGEYGMLLVVSSALVIIQRGAAIEGELLLSDASALMLMIAIGTMAWYEESKLEKRHYEQ